MSGALALAASIAAMDRDALHELVSSRHVTSPDAVQDPLSLALELFRSDSITRALHRLDRRSIAALRALGTGDAVSDTETVDRLLALGLLGVEQGEPVPLAEVDDALRLALANTKHGAHPSADPVGSHAGGIPGGIRDEPTGEADTSGWYAPALTSVRRAAALLTALREHPAVLGRRGTVTAVSVRDLAAAVRSEVEPVTMLLGVLQAAGLAVPATAHAKYHREQQLLLPSRTVPEWMRLPLHARWVVLARAAWSGVDTAILSALQTSDGDLHRAVREVLPGEYPLLPESARSAAKHLADAAEGLGLTVGGRLAPPAEALFTADEAGLGRAALEDFPEPVEGAYLQPDLSVIVPGPLAPEDEQALSIIAEAEHWGVAATLRISHETLKRAVTRGQSPEAIRSMLERLSLTGIPQPLDYLLNDLQRTLPLPGSTSGPAPGTATTVEDAAGASRPDEEHSADGSDAQARPASRATDPLDALVDRVYEAARAEPGTGELSRRLELAIRDRSAVRVTAAAGGEERSFVLLPVSLAGGRLRATDEGAGVQRTLPLTAIVAVEAA